MPEFKIKDLLKATQGKLISGKEEAQIEGISIDSRTIKPKQGFLAIKGTNFDGHNFIEAAIKKGASCVISEHLPAAYRLQPTACIEVKNTIKALGDIARFHRRRFNIPIIAVTGSNGKTTAKEMIAQVLGAKFKALKNEGTKNNQIGLPLTLLNLDSSYDFAVLEIGTNHFGEVAYLAKIAQANIGIITNIGPVHLEFLKNLSGVFREKYALIENLEKPYIAILNSDDALLRKKIIKKSVVPAAFGFGLKDKADFFAGDIQRKNKRVKFLVNQKYRFILDTSGYYNIYNALAAIAVGRLMGMEYKDIARALADFNFPAGRLNFMKLNNIKFIDDTYNSNPVSLRQALEALRTLRIKGRKIFVMGDMLELGTQAEFFHRQAGKYIADTCDAFIAVGGLSRLAAEELRKTGFEMKNIFTCRSSQEARNILLNKVCVRPPDLVLVKGSRAMKMEEVFKT